MPNQKLSKETEFVFFQKSTYKGHNMRLSPLSAIACLLPSAAFAINVAVVDSGTFFNHDSLRSHTWVNPNEIVENMVDDDGNGKVDDINGWNFAENLPKVFYPEHISKFDDRIFQVFRMLAKIRSKSVTDADKAWWQQNVQDLPKTEKEHLFQKLNAYGQYAHSTHCSGIIASGSQESQIMSARIFPDTQVPESLRYTEGLVYETFARVANIQFTDVAGYLNATQMPVANFSIGIPMSEIAKKAMALFGNKKPGSEQIAKESRRAYEAFERQGKLWMSSAPNTLFVIAAANDGSDNAVLPIFPANVQAPNAITVAATDGYASLADFSNWDINTVHVAAPGVNIVSTVPGPTAKEFLPMSGTSMAAPFVSMVATSMKAINPALSPAALRALLIATVDKKSWLKNKVASSGIVNKERALRAATLALTMSPDSAIAQARSEVGDMPELASELESFSSEESFTSPTREMTSWAKKLAF
jgi:subtilisin family serine protease